MFPSGAQAGAGGNITTAAASRPSGQHPPSLARTARKRSGRSRALDSTDSSSPRRRQSRPPGNAPWLLADTPRHHPHRAREVRQDVAGSPPRCKTD